MPLIGYTLAPDSTTRTVERVKDWFRRNGRRAGIIGATVIGGLLVARGVITLFS